VLIGRCDRRRSPDESTSGGAMCVRERARRMRARVCVWCARRASAAGVGGGRCDVKARREGSRRGDVAWIRSVGHMVRAYQ
jgi:hypothetical protein